jgi:micrococcal nuclease
MSTTPLPPPPAAPARHESPRRPRARIVGWLVLGALLTAVAVVPIVWFALLMLHAMSWDASPDADPSATTGTPVVREVVDGDTIVVRLHDTDEKVRLLGIDTPETKDPRKPVQCFGKEASAHTAELLPPGTEVHLVRDVEDRDRYDRILAYVYRAQDGLFVNLELARGGFADLLTYPPNVAHTSDFQGAVAEARREQRGLWQACGGPGRPA